MGLKIASFAEAPFLGFPEKQKNHLLSQVSQRAAGVVTSFPVIVSFLYYIFTSLV